MELAPISIDEATFLRGSFHLPPLPEVMTDLMDKINSGEATAAEVSELIASDPGLVAQMLKVINSAYYGLPRQITDIKHAVAYLGFGEIHRIVLTVAVMRSLEPEDGNLFRSYWSHSFFTALVSKKVAMAFEKTMAPGEIYTAAVLHDIGKLVYQKFFPEHYGAMAQYCKKKRVFLSDAEKEFGFPSHGRFGSLLCNRWQLGENLENACENHELETLHEALRAGDELPPDLKVVTISNLLTCLAEDSLNDGLKMRTAAAVQETVKITEDEFLVLMGDVYDLKSEVSRFLSDL